MLLGPARQRGGSVNWSWFGTRVTWSLGSWGSLVLGQVWPWGVQGHPIVWGLRVLDWHWHPQQSQVLSTFFFPHAEKSLSSLPGLGRVAMWVMWTCLSYPRHHVSSYFCATPWCSILSPGFLSSCESCFLTWIIVQTEVSARRWVIEIFIPPSF